MSGGSYDYIFCKLSNECEGRMYDIEMDDLIKDLCVVLKALEWWQSCDTSEEKYREELVKFKNKWFEGSEKRNDRLKEYIDEQLSKTKKELYNLIWETKRGKK